MRTGALQTFPHTRLISPPGPGTPYEYQLQQAAVGTIPKQHYVVQDKDIATVDESYYTRRCARWASRSYCHWAVRVLVAGS